MRRRLGFAILGTALGTLVLAALGTFVLARLEARAITERELRAQAEAIAELVTVPTAPPDGPGPTPRQRLGRIRQALELDDVELVVLDPADRVVEGFGGRPPEGLTVADLEPDRLRAGETVSGVTGGRVFAAAPLSTERRYLAVVVLIRPVESAVGPIARWFLLAGTVALAAGTVVALRLSRRLTEPLREAQRATARIAGGDLGVRLEEHGGSGGRDELDELAHSINEMAAALERERGLEQQFLLSVSHDLRTPLTSIRGYAEAIADGAAPDARAAAEVILSEARRLERLVADLLDLARLDAHAFSLDLQAVDLVALVADVVDGFGPAADTAGLALRFEAPVALVTVDADRDRLSQVVANLIENALKFAASTVTVRVVARDHDGPRLDVADDGPGIAPEDLPHVFERLYVASARPVRREVGSGLGLAIVRELVEAMDGTVRAVADPAGGTRMVVTLRPADPPAQAPGPDAAVSSAGSARTTAGTSLSSQATTPDAGGTTERPT